MLHFMAKEDRTISISLMKKRNMTIDYTIVG